MAKGKVLFVIWRAAVEKRIRENAFAYALIASAAITLKYRFSKASAEELYWLVAPLARLIELLAGIRFDWEPPNGFISTTLGVIIAPACSGVTFLVICFCTLSFSLVHRRKTTIAKLGWVALALLAAYVITLGANAVRIIAAIVLYRVDIYGKWITAGRVHRIVGIAVYLGVLIPVYLATERMTRVRALPLGSRLSEIRAYCPPFAWYILFTTMIPLLKTLGRNESALLTEHVLVVGIASAAAFAVCMGLIGIRDQGSRKNNFAFSTPSRDQLYHLPNRGILKIAPLLMRFRSIVDKVLDSDLGAKVRGCFYASPKRIDPPGGEREDDRNRRYNMVGTNQNPAKNLERKCKKAQKAAKRC